MNNPLAGLDKKKLFKSKILLLSVALVALLGALLTLSFILKKEEVKKEVTLPTQQETVIVPLEVGSSQLSTDALWKQTISDKMQDNHKGVKQTLEEKEASIRGDLKAEMEELRNEVRYAVDDIKSILSDSKIGNSTPLQTDPNEITNAAAWKAAKNAPITTIDFELNDSPYSAKYTPKKIPETYIPSMTFATGRLTMGAVAHTSQTASSNPDPVTIRLTDNGKLPRKFQSDLKDCWIGGESTGDESSQRVKMRLTQLVCTHKSTGQIVETEIVGMVVGPDGLPGVKGKLIRTDVKSLTGALLAGTLGGLSNNFNPNTAGTGGSISAVIEKNYKNPSFGSRMKESFASGGSNALNRVAEYQIDEAERLSNIIEVPNGIEVQILILKGTYIGENSVKDEIAKRRNAEIKKIAVKTADLGGEE